MDETSCINKQNKIKYNIIPNKQERLNTYLEINVDGLD